jgi:hypothetical protein
MPQFDIQGARKAGYSDDEIIAHLAKSRNFDVDGAKKSGYSSQEILSHLSPDSITQPEAKDPAQPGILNKAANAVSSTIAGLGRGLNPVPMVEGMVTAANAYNWKDIASGMVKAQGAVGRGAIDALGRGEYGTAIRKGINAAIPVLGPTLDTLGDRAQAGDPAGALGESVALGLTTFGGSLLPKTAQVVKGAANSAPVKKMVDFATARNIPLSAADVSDNMFIRGAQQVGSATAGGSVVATGKRANQASAMRRVASELMDEVSPQPMGPADAGRSVKGALDRKAAGLGSNANFEYGELAQLEKMPKNQTMIQTGQRTVQTGVLDAQGNPVTATIPITEKMAFPVDLKPLKQWASPILDKLKQRYNPADPEAAKVLSQQIKSLQSIVDGPDFKPASIADKDLSAVKALRRNVDVENEATMRGAQQLDILEAKVNEAVATDPKAIRALQRGRSEWAAKAEVEEIAAKLRDEPVQAFEQASWSKDSGVEYLKRIAKEVPGEMPKLGRAWLEEAFAKPMAEGGFSGGKGLAQKWQTLGPETKMILFKDPSLIANLDKFFTLAKKMDSPLNTSGTAAATAAGQLFNAAGAAAAYMDSVLPMIASQVGAAGFTALMYSPKFVAKLNQGLSLPLKSPARAAAIGQLVEMATEQRENRKETR